MNFKRIIAVFCIMFSAVAYLSAQSVVVDTLGGVKSVAASPAELLKGELSGVRVSAVDGSPNGLYNVNVRGLNTLRGDSQPLWIVDGAVIGNSVNQNLNAFYLSGGSTINGDALPDYSGKSYTYPLGNFAWLNPYDIESIEVLKDISATSLYGMQGANGVIIVKTRRPTKDERNIFVNSNVGVDMSSQTSEAFKTGILTTHDIGINGMFGTNSFYNLSGFLRYNDSSIQNTGSTSGGLTLNLETVANEVFKFGLHSFINYGDYTTLAGTNHIGAPSTMLLARYPEGFKGDSLNEWINSYDDEMIDYRTVNSVWLQINFNRSLYLKLAGGMDYQNQTRYLWFGKGTSFGKEYSGATGILNNSLMNYNFKGELNYDRIFAVKHRLTAKLAYDLNGNLNKTNAMCGTNFDLPYLRGKGLSSSASIHAISKFDRTYTQMGAYALLGYDFDGYAGVQGAVRCDETERFDKEPIIMPSGEAFVDFRKILFRNSKAVSALKVTGGYGEAGREVVLPYEYMNAYISNVPKIEKGTEPYYDGINRLLSKEWNVGFNVGFLNNRYNLSLKYYDKNTEDSFKVYNFGKVLSDMWVETENWTIEQESASTIRNNGFEVDADFCFIDTPNVTWTARVNAAYNINSVVALSDTDKSIIGIFGGQELSVNEEGQSVGYVMNTNVLPKVSGGIGTTLSLYGLTLDAKVSGAAGHSIINANRLVERSFNEFTETDIEKGDYLRLDHVTLSYDIPLNIRWIKAFKVNVTGHNLCTLTRYSGWNPDVNSFGLNARAYGVDYGSFPLHRTVVLGVSVRF